MTWYMVWSAGHGMILSMALRAWHGIWYGLAGMVWYMVWSGGHGMVYVLAWRGVAWYMLLSVGVLHGISNIMSVGHDKLKIKIKDQDSLLVKRRNDNHSPGPVIRELVPSSHQRSELNNTILCIFSG